ncbi:hypothetical protein CAPTEDRAFT_216951 [Capitella teleta]|uniref:CS domain-containing protein n=1 Tax=Capitella teleta TaxID=283909 RepID=R7T559_CAPTE|nr:hypothetical protein CAPTEDRAFT_216951 [Capitella teleta]|eukprot:ELT88163.1 hypothetical protein CAPTEDRAFT_216951 [Capitella teleta]
MAEEHFPGPVTFNEDDPLNGYVTLGLPVPELKVNRFSFGSKTAKNADFTKDFRTRYVSLKITVDVDGTEKVYAYRRRTNEDLTPDKTRWEVSKGMVKLHICKGNKVSWSEDRQRYLRVENEEPLS